MSTTLRCQLCRGQGNVVTLQHRIHHFPFWETMRPCSRHKTKEPGTPHPRRATADEIPGKVKQASFMWERGAKLQYTEPSPVDPSERAVHWGNTLLKQVLK